MVDASVIRERFAAVGCGLNERSRRLFAAAEAKTAGYGGIAATSRATGIARSTIGRGLKDLTSPDTLSGVVRRPGSGRQALTDTDPTLLEDLRQILEPATMGDPMRPLLWVSKSHEKLAAALRAMGHKIKQSSIPKMLGLLKYRRQVNRKTLEGSRNPDRNAQFEHINAEVIATQAAGQPVISIDTKKKEPIGPYKNAGSDYRPEGRPDQVNVHDFVDKELGKVVPYGVYDIAANVGCVNVGIDNDTAQFSVNSIRRWLDMMGRERYPKMDRLMITADGGGSNGSRVRLFKVELQKLADETGLTLQVCHYPPGTSKWNKIEHRLFCHITPSWRGKPPISRQTVVELIASTTTRTGLKVRCELDTRSYPKGIKVSNAEMATLNIKTGVAASTMGRGLRDLAAEDLPDPRRVRRRGGGRRPLTETDPGLLPALLSLVEPDERGDPMSPLRWTCKSLRHLADEMAAMGHKVSRTAIGQLLRAEKFSLQGNSKTEEGGEHEDRDAQFLHINKSVTEAMAAGQPVISVDTKKKELVDNSNVTTQVARD